MLFNKKAKKETKYYTNIYELPVYYWFKFVETFDFKYLHYKNSSIISTDVNIFLGLLEQLEKFDISGLREIAERQYKKALFLKTKNPIYLEPEPQRKGVKNSLISDFVGFIETSLNIHNSIDIMKTSTGKAYELFDRAIEKNKVNQSKWHN